MVLMDENTRQAWERFLNPDILRANLIGASTYVAAYELLRDTIIERIRDFYLIEADADGMTNDTEYRSDVLSMNRSPVYASLQWFKQSGAINDDDILAFERIKECRNTIAHEMDKILDGGLPPSFSDCFNELVSLLSKIERWWIVNIEIPITSDSVKGNINAADVIPGRILLIQMLFDIALGSEDASKFYLNKLVRHTGGV